ncbi:MAG: alpha/beta fold hydrolase [Polyangiaceae bacterium]|nr:alpha/beta fold hydrolase [Polyangiaceae bacterium]
MTTIAQVSRVPQKTAENVGIPITVVAADGRRLTGEVFEPAPGETRAVVVIAPAMGVPRGYYRPFAKYLASGGLAVLVADYRGVGDSRLDGKLSEDRATLRDWGELDVPAMIETARSLFPSVPTLYVGHSVGGQLFGLDVHDDVRAAIFVGSQSGYWRHWSGAPRLGMLAMWYLVIPTFTQGLGYLPMSAFKAGEDLPRDVARDWARWGRHPDYVMSYAEPRGGVGFKHWSGDLLSFAIEDDAYAPLRGVEALVSFYANARGRTSVVRPHQLGEKSVGHFGFFRPKFERTLWKTARDWLVEHASST